MSISNRSTAKRPEKPSKPYTDFPLFAHQTRRWAKKIRGKLHYFGPWADPQGALAKYLDQHDDLHAGRTPRVQGDGLTVRDLVNRFLTSKRCLRDTRELTERTFTDYYSCCARLVEVFGATRLVANLAADDFERLRASLAEKWGPTAVGNEVQRVRSLFKYAYEAALVDKPARLGPGFKKPSRKTLRIVRAGKGPRMFEADEVQKLLAAAGQPMKAMILLAVNAGLGNNDVGRMPLASLDLAGGWLNYPRPKTGINRRAPLWPETVAAIQEALAKRPHHKSAEHAGLAFITKYGEPWAKDTPDSPVAKEMAKLMKRLGLRQGGRGFYSLRHVFETVAGESRDQVAVDYVMGHAREDMATVYRERISDERLRTVAECVRKWLFADKTAGK